MYILKANLYRLSAEVANGVIAVRAPESPQFGGGAFWQESGSGSLANYLGEGDVRELPLHYPSWRQMSPERKARVVANIRTQFDLVSPHMNPTALPQSIRAIHSTCKRSTMAKGCSQK
ncbi:hypothetical protein Tco_0218714 [Tanacetum coccineum]